MKHNNITRYFLVGVDFLKMHPQIWLTFFTAVVIISAFIFTAYRFSTIAQETQEQYINDRVGWIYDALTVFVPDVLEQPDVLRARLAEIKSRNETIKDITILAPYTNNEWRVYVSDTGEREGTLIKHAPDLYIIALSDPERAFTSQTFVQGERYFTTARAIRNASGQPTAIVVTHQSLSEADRIIADRIHSSMYTLIGIVLLVMFLFIRHARIVDYATLYRRQVEIDKMKDGFISMASHELKSPLTVIRGYIEYLKDASLPKKKKEEFLRRIDTSLEELRALIDDILDVSRIEMGRMRFSIDYIRPYEVVEEVVEMFQKRAREKGLTLSAVSRDNAQNVKIRVDRGRLKQALVNLVSNAIKYTPKGTVVVTQKQEGTSVILEVRDTGIGLTADEQRHLFSKFYRVQSTETERVRGTGLGLWITKYIIEHMGGSISVESIKGEGSRFVITFPLFVEEKHRNM